MERFSGPIKKKPSGHKLFPKGFRSPESENRTFPIVFPLLLSKNRKEESPAINSLQQEEDNPASKESQ